MRTRPAPNVDRRRFLRKAGLGAAVTGAAISAPIVIDSFTSPAWASGTGLFHSSTYNSTVSSVSVTAGRAVEYDISGAGGGGASTANNPPITHEGGDGGAGTRLTGTIPAGGGYTLYIAIGQKGNRGVLSPGSAEQTKGLSSYAGAASDT
ncbi:MAG: twin-arginine translocation signal domain-containing protein [Microthrixaceae bacterium]